MTKRVSALDMNKNELQNARIQNLAAAPGTPVGGQMYYDTSTSPGVLYWYDGTGWQAAKSGTPGADSITNNELANMAQSTIKGRAAAAGTGDPQDLTAAQVKTLLAIVAADISDFATAVGNIAVLKSTYDANTILAATTDDTPAALTIGASTIVGRGAAGGISALTAAQTKTILAVVAADISDFNTAVRTNRLDQMAAPTASVSMGSQKITNLADGVAGTDAITLNQLTAAVQGLEWKAPVRVATTANIANPTTGAPNIVDGVTLVVGDRVLLKDQSTGAQNGIYTVTTVGTGANGVWARSLDMDVAAEANNATVLVEAGTVNGGDVWTQTATIVTIGTTAMTWTKTSEGNTTYTNGTGLTLTGSTFSITAGGVGVTEIAAAIAGNGLTGGGGSALAVNPDGTTIEVSSDAVRIAAGAAGAGLTGGGGAALAVGAGTGISVAADSVAVDTAVVVRKYTALIGNGALTSIPVTHGLGNQWSIVQVVEVSSLAVVECDVVLTDANTVTLGFSTAPASNSLRVIVQG